MSTTEYIVIRQQVWMNQAGHGVNYYWDWIRHPSRQAALAHGWREEGTDDFNIGTLADGRLVAFGWGEQDFGPDRGDDEPHGGYDLAEIAQHICVEVGVSHG
jgi:hypothetical protein